MKWIYYVMYLGYLFLLIVTPSKAKIRQTFQEMETSHYDVSGLRDIGIPDLRIVQPDPVPGPKPMPDPGEKPETKTALETGNGVSER